ncbi:MAG TPA: DUF86 domain-containing protein [Candidatus Ozemobacteraceae bacterium]|nr:DUF86 domain-containing protein [Candidatus Ozemobacteraceae bacterium]
MSKAFTQARMPQIQWGLIIGMRNRLIHAYFDIDHQVVWQTVTIDLPPLIEHLQQFIADIEPDV